MKYLDASENLSLSFLSYLSILKIENGGWVLQLLSFFTFSHSCSSDNGSSLYYRFWFRCGVAECLQLQVVKVLQTTFLPSRLCCYIVDDLWAFLCRGVLYVNQELKISVCFADLIMQVYAITVLVLTHLHFKCRTLWVLN